MSSSKLIQKDQYTEQSYAMDGFDPRKNDSKYSYTSGRVMKRVYNKYETKNKPKVFGYYTDWSQYDKRAAESKTGAIPAGERGRGIDITQLSPTAYDKLIIGFMGIVGDEGENRSLIERAAAWTGKKTNEMTILDPWGDCQSYFNNGFSGWKPFGFGPAGTYQDGTSEDCFYQSKVQGVLGALRDLQDKAKQQGHSLALSFSLGGWTMSHAFHQLVKSDSAVDTLVASIIDLFKRFPMFSEIDVDWEYPNGPGNGNPHGPEDGENYVRLISRLRKALDSNGLKQVKISIASSANVTLLKESNIKGLLAAGLYGINVMTYDFFGTPWAERLGNHANIYKTAHTEFSLQEAVEYLLEQGVDPEHINVGYAGYSRSAKGAKVDSFSPLSGTYNGNGTTVGTFESGCVEWCDILNNYLDLENQCGRNGYHVYTDAEACADYLYNPDIQVFHSIDTPRTVREKARYVIEKGLGGLFTWTIDQDNGLLVNAAREGMGCGCINQVIDMQPFYFTGENITDEEKEEEEQKEEEQQDTGENQGPDAQVILKCVSGSRLTFSAQLSSDPDNDPLTFTWQATGNATIVSPRLQETDIIMPVVESDTSIQVSVVVDDAHGHQAQDTYHLIVTPLTDEGQEDQDQGEKDEGSTTTYPLWDASASYSGGTRVSHKGGNYLAKWWIGAGVEPGLSSTTGAASGDALPWTKI
ncbi:glycosyl hydrolase family 18 protein [Enterobacter mori]|uniref:glycosyl hydrolase family 18 protein n=1 Tax=Enterobacter mori TaxID=539813 RepID=UPI001B8B7E4A|nr:glycosyl hydrolase family 18 protein [Enterobacter mori]MBS3046372.1 chitinase [Enterobacter mori]